MLRAWAFPERDTPKMMIQDITAGGNREDTTRQKSVLLATYACNSER